jgi:hypothetical protein
LVVLGDGVRRSIATICDVYENEMDLKTDLSLLTTELYINNIIIVNE